MISPGELNPSLHDNTPNASEKRLKLFQSTLIDATDSFYNMEGDIIIQKNDIDGNMIISNSSSTSSGSRRRSYQSRTGKEKQKKRHEQFSPLQVEVESGSATGKEQEEQIVGCSSRRAKGAKVMVN